MINGGSQITGNIRTYRFRHHRELPLNLLITYKPEFEPTLVEKFKRQFYLDIIADVKQK